MRTSLYSMAFGPDAPGSQFVDESVNYHYTYPLKGNKSLRPHNTNELHGRLRDYVMERAVMSREFMRARYDSWNIMDQMMTAYIPVSDAEEEVLRKDPRKPVSIVVPVSYAVLETLMTYLMDAILTPPVFRFKPTGPEDVIGVAMIEEMLRYQVNKSRMGLNLYTQIRDSLIYGIGVSALSWDRQFGWKSEYVNDYTPSLDELDGAPQTYSEREVRKRGLIYEGNKLSNIDPYMYLPDPNVPAHEYQEGEFCGWVHRTNYTKLLGRELDSDGGLFNVKYLKDIDGRSILYDEDPSNRNRDNAPDVNYHSLTKPIDVIYMYCTIIPEELGLTKSNRPQKWLFALAGDSVIIQASRVDLNHGMYPIGICAPDFDGYSPMPLSRLEVVYGLQKTINWLYSSHITNVRKAINDVLIVDPSRINMADLLEPKAGGIVRMRSKVFGTGLKDAVEQLKVTDITRTHIGDSNVMLDLVNRVTGAVDNIQGLFRNKSADVSATEASDVNQGAKARMVRLARIIGAMMIQPIGHMMASHMQQFSEMESYIPLTTGRYADTLRQIYGDAQYALGGPDQINVNYDMIEIDGSLPNTGNSAVLLQMFQMAAGDPELRQVYDLTRMFSRIGQMAGFNNMLDFLKQGPQVNTQVMPDEQVAKQANLGNIVRLGGNGYGG